MDPATLAALGQLATHTSLGMFALILGGALLWWALKGPVNTIANAQAAKLMAEGGAAKDIAVAHTATLAEVTKTLQALQRTTAEAVAADGSLTRAALEALPAKIRCPIAGCLAQQPPAEPAKAVQ